MSIKENKYKMKRKRKLEIELIFHEPDSDNEVPLADFQNRHTELQHKIAEKEDKIDVMRSKLNLPCLSGRVTNHLDPALCECQICKQAYHGRSFVGNHCHKCMQADTITRLCDSVINKTKQLVDENSIELRARETSQKFKTLNSCQHLIHDHCGKRISTIRIGISSNTSPSTGKSLSTHKWNQNNICWNLVVFLSSIRTVLVWHFTVSIGVKKPTLSSTD